MEKDLGIRAISRGIAVLQAVNRHGSLTKMEIANEVGLPYPTTCRILDTLIGYGMIKRDSGGKRYRPTALVQTLSLGYQQEDRLAVIARPFIVEMTQKLTWPVSVCSRIGMNMVIRESTHALTPFTLNVYHAGYTLPLLASSSGKAYLAFCSSEERDAIIDALRHFPESAGYHVNAMERALETIRQRGFSVEDKLQHTANPGRTSSISAPIFEEEALAGTLTLIYFSSAMLVEKAIERFAAPVKDCARMISSRLSEPETGGVRSNAMAGLAASASGLASLQRATVVAS